jgi:crossover junction endodeoxyribonuclease RuvC
MFLGLDLSLCGTGVVIIDSDGNYTEKLIKSNPPKIKNPTTEVRRLMKIRDEIKSAIMTERIEIATIEGISYMSKNSTSTSQLSGLNYMVREMLMKIGIPFVIVAPTSLKKFATGKGNCGKDVMMLEIYKRWGVSILNDNVADAYALARAAEAVNKELKLTGPQKEVINLLRQQTE